MMANCASMEGEQSTFAPTSTITTGEPVSVGNTPATAGRSTLLITHDFTGLDQVDEIVVLDRGQVAQRGTHRELIRADGPYRQLHG